MLQRNGEIMCSSLKHCTRYLYTEQVEKLEILILVYCAKKYRKGKDNTLKIKLHKNNELRATFLKSFIF